MVRSGRHRVAGDAPGTGGPPARPGRWLRATAAAVGLVAVASVVLVAVAVTVPTALPQVAGRATAATVVDIGGVGLPIRSVPSDEADRDISRQQQRLVAAIVTDLTTFWSEAMPRVYGEPFTPLRGGLTAMDSSASAGSAPCVSSPAHIVGNAFYCPSDDGIIYDSAALVPVLLHRYGVPGLIATFAHEFGHAVQAQVAAHHAGKVTDETYPSLFTEAQGDCDAGSFVAWVADGHAPHLAIGADGLARAVGPLVDFADPVTVSPTASTAHGLGLDRLTWFLEGYRGGADACAGMTASSLAPTLGEVSAPSEAADAASAPRFADRRAIIDAARDSFRAWGGGQPPGGHGPDASARAVDDALSAVAAYGQFAQATAWVVTTVRAAGGDGPHASCVAGAWTGSVFGKVPAGSLGSWPGDADEGLAAVRHLPGATFDDAAAYAGGFHQGRAACPAG